MKHPVFNKYVVSIKNFEKFQFGTLKKYNYTYTYLHILILKR